jgi:anti-anti-sigma factor
MTCADPEAGSGSTPNTKVVRLEGDIDLATSAALGDWLCELVTGNYDTVVVTCDAVTFVESRGLAMMARVQRFADDAGCRLSWHALPLNVLRTIHLSGLDAYLHIEA